MVNINGQVKTIHQCAKGIGGWFGIVVAIYVGAATLGMDLPTPAWSSDISRLEAQFTALDTTVLEIKLEIIRGRIYDVQKDLNGYTRTNQPVPEYIQTMFDDLEDKEATIVIILRDRARSGS